MESRGLTLADHLAKLSDVSAGPGVSPADLTRVGDALKSAVDPVHGGLSGAPKFPNAPIFRFFWNEMFRRGDPSFGEALRAMLEAMNAGGIYDHLGGGYARYSTDAEWLVPHFEKMLYDNAQILELLALVHSLVARSDSSPSGRVRRSAGSCARCGSATPSPPRSTPIRTARKACSTSGTKTEVDAALGEAARRFKAAYDVTRGGNWEDRTVLRRITPRGSPEEEAGLAASRAKLFALREARSKPGRDDKVLADWNGLTIAALARASAVFDEPAWLQTARAAFDFIMTKLRGPDGRLLHAWREGHPGARALLDDYASMARAALSLFEASGEPADLEAARRLASEAIDLFGDGAGGFFLTASDAADVPGARPRQAHDGATPSGIGLLAEDVRAPLASDRRSALGRSGRGPHPRRLRRARGARRQSADPHERRHAGARRLGGRSTARSTIRWRKRSQRRRCARPIPSLTVLRLDRRLWPNGSPRDDLPRAEAPIAMLCQGQTCTLPVTTAEQLQALIRARRETAPGGHQARTSATKSVRIPLLGAVFILSAEPCQPQ